MRVKEVDYGTFIRMTTELNVDEVEIQDNQIVFSDKNGNFYKTGLTYFHYTAKLLLYFCTFP